jgi:hypothetical protein
MACELSLHNAFVEALKRFTSCLGFHESLPACHLLGKRALRAIGIVLNAKVLVNLKKNLLLRVSFQKLLAPRIISEKARCSGFQSTIR